MTKILGFSGKKQGGKNTAANWIMGQQMVASEMVSWVRMNDKGKLVVPAIVDDQLSEGVLDLESRDPRIWAMLDEFVWPVVKTYSFADNLKQICMLLFGLTEEQCYGTNEEKNTPTRLLWDHMPVDPEEAGFFVEDQNMTGREVLQYFGTDIIRRMWGNAWVDSCIRRIQQDAPDLALITDIRFPNEVEGVQAAGGKVVRFLRAPFAGEDEHESETALDDYPLEAFDHVCDNRELTIPQQNKDITMKLIEWEYNAWELKI